MEAFRDARKLSLHPRRTASALLSSSPGDEVPDIGFSPAFPRLPSLPCGVELFRGV